MCCWGAPQVLKLVEAQRPVTRQMWVTHMLPVGLFMAMSLQLGNYVYLKLTVAFIQVPCLGLLGVTAVRACSGSVVGACGQASCP